jgi:hypothetical protein
MLHPYSAIALLSAALALPAAAQTASPAAQAASAASPLDARASVPPLRYRPAFAGYKVIGEQPLGDWKAANDLTAEIGGWRTYAKQAREADPPAAGAAAPSASMPAGHQHHKTR